MSKSKRFFNVKSSAYYFYMKTKILTDFQICISVPLWTPYGSRNFEIGSCCQHDFSLLLWWLHPWIVFDIKVTLKRKGFFFYITWINFFLTKKTQAANKFWLNFLCNMNELFAYKKHKMINFDWIDSNLIVHNLLISYRIYSKELPPRISSPLFSQKGPTFAK